MTKINENHVSFHSAGHLCCSVAAASWKQVSNCSRRQELMQQSTEGPATGKHAAYICIYIWVYMHINSQGILISYQVIDDGHFPWFDRFWIAVKISKDLRNFGQLWTCWHHSNLTFTFVCWSDVVHLQIFTVHNWPWTAEEMISLVDYSKKWRVLVANPWKYSTLMLMNMKNRWVTRLSNLGSSGPSCWADQQEDDSKSWQCFFCFILRLQLAF